MDVKPQRDLLLNVKKLQLLPEIETHIVDSPIPNKESASSAK